MPILKKFTVAIMCLGLLLGAEAVRASEGGDAKPKGPIYVDFKNIVIPVIKKNGRTGVVAISMMAEVHDDKAEKKVTDHMPRLRDAFIRTLYGNLDSSALMKENGSLDIDRIKERLMHTADLVMKTEDHVITDILFQNISQQAF